GGATLLAGGAGLMALVLRNDKAASYNDCIKVTSNACDDLHNQATQWQQWEAAAFVAAGVLAAATITLAIVTSGDSPADPPSVAFGCAPVLTAPGLTCSARF